MAQRLKRWESPRAEGRNDKGRGGSARQRQKRKQVKTLRNKLKAGDRPPSPPSPANPNKNREEPTASRFFYGDRQLPAKI